MHLKLSKTGAVVVQGNVYTGKEFSLDGDSFLVDGIEVDLVTNSPSYEVTVHGDVESLSLNKGVVKTKSVNNVVTVSGNVAVAGDLTGKVETVSGDVVSRTIIGSVSSISGDIFHNGEIE